MLRLGALNFGYFASHSGEKYTKAGEHGQGYLKHGCLEKLIRQSLTRYTPCGTIS
jgi:hypothetical protein